MIEVCRHHTGVPIPPTFQRGSVPINGIFATQGIKCVNVFILPHLGGVGDHRCFILDLSSESVIGTSFPNIVRSAARKLHCKSPRMIKVYNSELTRVCDEHNMFHRMDVLLRLTPHFTQDNFAFLINAWDGEFTELQIHSKNHCDKFMMGHIEWSPTIGIWLNRQWLLHQVRLWMLGVGCPDPRNMFRDCFRLNIPDPRTSTIGTICTQIMATEQEIARLSKDAPMLRRQHLLGLVQDAELQDDGARAKTILEILKREEMKKRWSRINHTTRSPRGANPTVIQVPTDEGNLVYDTEDDVIDQSAQHLSKQFRLAYSAPVFTSEIMNDIGFLGDTQQARDILEGTYAFPPDTDKWTRKILKEAHESWLKIGDKYVDTSVTINDFQAFWQGVNEKTSSSYSRVHFGHYKAASHDRNLFSLHAAKLTSCAIKDVPLQRWGVGLTVLLEKTQGNNSIHKMRAIVLLEARKTCDDK